MLSERERQRVLYEWNDTKADYPKDRTVHALFEEQVQRTPGAVAVAFKGEELTYRELDARANRLAHRLRELETGPEVLVGVCAERSLEMVTGLLAVLKAGGACVPLDPSYPKARLGFMLEDSGARVLLAQEHLAERLPARPRAEVVLLDAGRQQAEGAEDGEGPQDGAKPGNLAYAIYTSGSTGTPKGVMLSHRNLVNRFAWMWLSYPFSWGEICCQKTAISFVDSIWEIFGPLLQGIPLILIDNESVKFPPRLVKMLADKRVTRVVLVPSLLRALLAYYGSHQNRLMDLKLWVSSGEQLPVRLLEDFLDALPESRLLNLYGSSEVTGDVLCYDTRSADGVSGRVPIGRPIANARVYVLDDRLQPVPIGAPGELYVGGAGVSRGYLHRPALTAERFVPDPFSGVPGARLYRTGDLARWLTVGNLEFLGRADDQVKIRGFRVEPGEVEAAMERHPKVERAVVTAWEDEASKAKRLVGHLVPTDAGEAPPAAQELRCALERTLPEYMVPSLFVLLEELPLTPSGKVDRMSLAARGSGRIL